MTIYGVNFRHNGRLSRHWLRHKIVEAQNHVPVLLSPEKLQTDYLVTAYMSGTLRMLIYSNDENNIMNDRMLRFITFLN